MNEDDQKTFEYPVGLSTIFKDQSLYIDSLIQIYSKIFDLEPFSFKIKNLDYYQSLYCKQMGKFIILVIYSLFPTRSIFFSWQFSNQTLAWDLPGSGLGDQKRLIRDCIKSTIERFLPFVRLNTVSPIATVDMIYNYKTEQINHNGLVFACSVDNITKYMENNPDLRGVFVPIDKVSEVNLTNGPNKKVIQYATEYIKSLEHGSISAADEIEEQSKYKDRYLLHDKVFKKIILGYGKVYRYKDSISKREYKNTIRDLIEEDTDIVLDIAAGDDENALRYSEKSKWTVLNDLSWDTLNILTDKIDNYQNRNIIFTNEDILNCNFKSNCFDVIVCKNVLHHFNSIVEMKRLFDNLKLWSKKRIIISEVLNPKEVPGVWSRIKDLYYSKYLHDVGDSLLKKQDMKEIVKVFFPANVFKAESKWYLTVMGYNCLVVIDKTVTANKFEEAYSHLNTGDKTAAAFTAGIILEKHLKAICVDKGTDTFYINNSGKQISKRAAQLNDDLYRNNIYESTHHKSIISWLDIRNKAAHGEEDKFNVRQVKLMINGIENFLTEYRI